MGLSHNYHDAHQSDDLIGKEKINEYLEIPFQSCKILIPQCSYFDSFAFNGAIGRED